MNYPRKRTRPVKVGSLVIGNCNPIPLQTMWKEPLLATANAADLEKIILRIHYMARLGCDIIRFAVPDGETVDVLAELAEAAAIPIVADIHFDYKLALACFDTKIAKIRINPGNLGAVWKMKEVLRKAKDTDKPIRVGINGGSLPSKLRKEGDAAAAMVKAAEEEAEILARENFTAAIFSLKSSNIADMIAANIQFSERFDYPLHIGMTEAGPLIPGIVRNSIGISKLLHRGIGDTVRVSISDSPENEIITGKGILSAENLDKAGVKIVSCPTCGRKTFDVEAFLREIGDELQVIRRDITVAVMGCEVNGPEEARNADLGITGAGNRILLFKKGEIIARTDKLEGKRLFLHELRNIP